MNIFELEYNKINKLYPAKSLYKTYYIKRNEYNIYNDDGVWFYKAYFKDNGINPELVRCLKEVMCTADPFEVYLKSINYHKELIQYNCLFPIRDSGNIIEISDFSKNVWCRYNDCGNPKYKVMSKDDINKLFSQEFYIFKFDSIFKNLNISDGFIDAIYSLLGDLFIKEYNGIKIKYWIH